VRQTPGQSRHRQTSLHGLLLLLLLLLVVVVLSDGAGIHIDACSKPNDSSARAGYDADHCQAAAPKGRQTLLVLSSGSSVTHLPCRRHPGPPLQQHHWCGLTWHHLCRTNQHGRSTVSTVTWQQLEVAAAPGQGGCLAQASASVLLSHLPGSVQPAAGLVFMGGGWGLVASGDNRPVTGACVLALAAATGLCPDG
jgi:hypothetical protein